MDNEPSKTVLVLGASTKPDRYSYKAIVKLQQHQHRTLAVGNGMGRVGDVAISQEMPKNELIHTITLYLSAANQEGYIPSILALKPQRIIFNPGAENPTLKQLAKQQGIETLNACTLVMLATGQF